jgi:KUP system potassium uptake protein
LVHSVSCSATSGPASPIYTIQTVFNPSDPHPVPISADHVYGVVSLIFWSVMIIVTLTYVTLVMRADNDGEGGIMALITLLQRWGGAQDRRTVMALAALGLFGAALFFGDSMITPAISVLSAVEGLKVVAPGFDEWIVPTPRSSSWRCSRSSATAQRPSGASSGR